MGKVKDCKWQHEHEFSPTFPTFSLIKVSKKENNKGSKGLSSFSFLKKIIRYFSYFTSRSSKISKRRTFPFLHFSNPFNFQRQTTQKNGNEKVMKKSKRNSFSFTEAFHDQKRRKVSFFSTTTTTSTTFLPMKCEKKRKNKGKVAF